jgi:3-deoxy-7-phosphoheptulonate synthase
MTQLENINIGGERSLPTPLEIKKLVPVTPAARDTVLSARDAIKGVLAGTDNRLVVVVGPCSIHDPSAAREYAERLKALAAEVSSTMIIVMRVYFEKPRTVSGWKGFINDPGIDGTFRMEDGLVAARKLLVDINSLGVPAATEALDLIMPQYLADLISWTAIGARTTESQTHRELASGLSSPVGFKNGTDGNVQVALNALRAAAHAHHFLSVGNDGRCAVFETKGNQWGHVVLRGGRTPNYDQAHIAQYEGEFHAAGIVPRLMVDCSHGNSMKDHNKQPMVLRDCIAQRVQGNRSIMGLMLESNLEAGNQPIPKDLAELRYGVSITDACIGWDTTASILSEAHEMLRALPSRLAA